MIYLWFVLYFIQFLVYILCMIQTKFFEIKCVMIMITSRIFATCFSNALCNIYEISIMKIITDIFLLNFDSINRIFTLTRSIIVLIQFRRNKNIYDTHWNIIVRIDILIFLILNKKNSFLENKTSFKNTPGNRRICLANECMYKKSCVI